MTGELENMAYRYSFLSQRMSSDEAVLYSDSDRDHVLCSQDSCKTPNPAKNYLGKSGWEQEHAQP